MSDNDKKEKSGDQGDVEGLPGLTTQLNINAPVFVPSFAFNAPASIDTCNLKNNQPSNASLGNEDNQAPSKADQEVADDWEETAGDSKLFFNSFTFF